MVYGLAEILTEAVIELVQRLAKVIRYRSSVLAESTGLRILCMTGFEKRRIHGRAGMSFRSEI